MKRNITVLIFIVLSFFLFIHELPSENHAHLDPDLTDSIYPRTDPKTIGIIYQMLKVLDIELQKHDIKYWMDFGTLLGAVRHEGMIPWDDDADVCILVKDEKKIMSLDSIFRKYGLKLEVTMYSNMIKLNRVHAYYPWIDIFIYGKKNSKKHKKIFHGLVHRLHWSKDEISNFKRTKFGPISLNMPSKGVMKQLHSFYGIDCMTKARYHGHSDTIKTYPMVTIKDFSPAYYEADGSIIDLDNTH